MTHWNLRQFALLATTDLALSLSLSYCSNTEILVKHALLPFKNATTEEYDAAIFKINETDFKALQLSECTLKKELDNVSSRG